MHKDKGMVLDGSNAIGEILAEHLDIIKLAITTDAPEPCGTSKTKLIKKKNKEHRKRKETAQALWLKTRHVIGLVIAPDLKDPTWDLLRDARTRLMFVDNMREGDLYYAMTNWRFMEIQLIVVMIAKEWLKLTPVSSWNASLYKLACDTAYSMRVHLGQLFGNHVVETAPKANDPESCYDQLPIELLMLTRVALSDSSVATVTVSLMESWYAHLSVIVMSIVEITTAHSVEIVVPFHKKPGGNIRTMETVPLLPFLSFHKTEDFPTLLEEWSRASAKHHAVEGRNFNYKEVCAYMEKKWDEAMLGYLEGDVVRGGN